MHVACPDDGLDEPGAHDAHSDAPTVAAYLPYSHSLQMNDAGVSANDPKRITNTHTHTYIHEHIHIFACNTGLCTHATACVYQQDTMSIRSFPTYYQIDQQDTVTQTHSTQRCMCDTVHMRCVWVHVCVSVYSFASCAACFIAVVALVTRCARERRRYG